MFLKRMPYRTAIVIVILIITSLVIMGAACGAASAPSPALNTQTERAASAPIPPINADKGPAAKEAAPAIGDEGAAAGTGNFDGETQRALQAAQAPRMIVYNGSLSLIVRDTQETVTGIRSLVEEKGGFISASNLVLNDKALQGSITVRIPSESFFETMEAIKKLSMRVQQENSNTTDVTEEFTDLDARKKNLQVTETALQDLLDQRKRTGSTADILEVYRELTDVRGQIEQIQGRQNYLSRLSALSTIEIGLTPDIMVQPINVAGWQPQGTAKEALQALIRSMQVVVDALIWFIILLLPLLLVILLPIVALVLIIRRLIRGRQARKTAKEVPPVEKK
jgi:hypothetical protein